MFSTLAGPTDSYKCGLLVFPAGTEAAPTYNPPKQVVSAFLKVVAPESFEDWSCENVSYTITVKSRKNNRSDISLADKFTFTRKCSDHGWHDLFRDKALSDYVSPEGELHVQGTVRNLPYVAAKAVPKVLFPDLDLTKEMKMITFKLADGPPLFFDQRLLIARSDYFKSMLIKEDWRETRTGEVDFTNNSDVTRESLQAILHYMLTDSLDLQRSLEFYLTVRELADRFCLSGLVTIADAEMASLVNEGNVLQILGKTYDTNSCWAEIVLTCFGKLLNSLELKARRFTRKYGPSFNVERCLDVVSLTCLFVLTVTHSTPKGLSVFVSDLRFLCMRMLDFPNDSSFLAMNFPHFQVRPKKPVGNSWSLTSASYPGKKQLWTISSLLNLCWLVS